MSKILIYAAIAFTLAAAALGYLNDHRYKVALASKNATIAELQQSASAQSAELQKVKETLSTESADQEKHQQEMLAAKEAQDKATADLAQAQKQLVDKDATITQLQTDLSAKTAAIQELQAQQTNAPTPAFTGDESKQKLQKKLQEALDKQKTLEAKLKAAMAPVDVLDQQEPTSQPKKEKELTSSGGLEGKVLALDENWNFVVISLGDQNGVINGSTIIIKREGQVIAKAKITSVESSTSVADIIPASVPKGITVKPGDTVVYSGSK